MSLLPQKEITSTTHFEILDDLRGWAALAVCIFHVTIKSSNTDLLFRIADLGYLGVELFFIISGIVIPYSMLRGNYQLTDFWRFMSKRMMRLYPPYLFCISLVVLSSVLLKYVLNFHEYNLQFLTPENLLGNLFYFPWIKDFCWVIDTSWTLCVEFYYYLIIGILFSLLFQRGLVWQVLLTILSLAISYFIGTDSKELSQIPFFLIGLSILRLNLGSTNKVIEYTIILTCLLVRYLFLIQYGVPSALNFELLSPIIYIGMEVLMIIAIFNLKSGFRLSKFLGKISYPLYLVHLPIIMISYPLLLKCLNKWNLPQSEYLSIIPIVLFSVFVAWVVHKFVEVPAMRWSGKIKYNRVVN